jgi:hypothetical protein
VRLWRCSPVNKGDSPAGPRPQDLLRCARDVDDSVDIHTSHYRESAGQAAEAKAAGEHESERTRMCVSERAEPANERIGGLARRPNRGVG